MAFIDFDEYIVPHFNYTLTEMIQMLSKRVGYARCGSFSFQNTFFYLQFPNDAEITVQDKIQNQLVTQVKTQRKSKLNPQGERSKYICRPERIVEVGNHFIWEYVRGNYVFNVDSGTAMLHHYRVRFKSYVYAAI